MTECSSTPLSCFSYFHLPKKKKSCFVQNICCSLCLPGCLSTLPYACLQVDWPGWLLGSYSAIFIVLPEEEFGFYFSGLLRPGSCKDLLSPLGPHLILSLPVAGLVSLGDSAGVSSVMMCDEDLPWCCLLLCLR